jgi:hypothetical protein
MLAFDDNSLLSWLVVAAYFSAAIMSVLVAVRADRIFCEGRVLIHRLVWSGLAGLMFFLSINKQLDLQTDFTNAVKTIAAEQGWYAYGQKLQVWFIAGLTCAGLMLLLALIWALRAHLRQYWLLLLGILLLASFITVRAATFYGVQLYPLSRLSGWFRVNGILEIVGGVLICLGAIQNLRVLQHIP